LTDFTNTEDLKQQIRDIWKKKENCDQNAVLMSGAFGYITQTDITNNDAGEMLEKIKKNPGGEQSGSSNEYLLEAHSADIENTFKHQPPVPVNDDVTLGLFINNIIGQINELTEKRNKDTRTRIVCVYSILINCNNILMTGKAEYGIACDFAICVFIAIKSQTGHFYEMQIIQHH
jgi:hypothetical protein